MDSVIHVQWSDCGQHIRKWSWERFDGAESMYSRPYLAGDEVEELVEVSAQLLAAAERHIFGDECKAERDAQRHRQAQTVENERKSTVNDLYAMAAFQAMDEGRLFAGERELASQTVIERITEYLSSGGLVNPELMDHAAVRDLLIAARAALTAPTK